MQNFRALVPVVLFVVFAGVHFAASKGSHNALELLAVSGDAPSGRALEKADLTRVALTVPDPDAEWLKPFIRSAEEADVIGQKLRHSVPSGNLLSRFDFVETRAQLRELQKGEVGLQVPITGVEFVPGQIWVGSTLGFAVQDINPADGTPRTRVLRPFRVVAIGDIVAAERGREESNPRQNSRVITIAARLERDASGAETLDANSMELVQATSPERDSRIVSVVIIPDTEQGGRSQ